MAADSSATRGALIDSNADKRHVWICAALVVAAVVVVSYPNVAGFWGRDDFICVALARMVGSPWQFFIGDHFFAPGAVFRPLGFFSEWLCVKLFGTTYAPNAAFDIALHAAVAFLVFRTLLRASIPPLVAALTALLFALHPAVLGPTLWWSGRFDVLSTLFILVSIGAGIRYRENVAFGSLVLALVAALAAALSKEHGLIAIGALTVLWGRWAWIEPARRRDAFTGIALAWLVGAVFFIWRRLVLGTFSSGFTGTVPLGEAFPRGLLNWVQQAPGYLSFFTHMPTFAIALIVIGVIGTLVMATIGVITTSRPRRSIDIDVLLIGALLFVAPIIVQAPIAAFGSPLSADMSAIEAGMQSRLYYVQSVGAAFMLAAVIGPLWQSMASKANYGVVASLTLVVATFGWVSWGNAREFGQRSFDIAAPARAAVAAIDGVTLPEDHCHIAFMGYEAPPEWSIYVSMDSIVKALSSNKQVRHCWIHSNLPTFTYLQDRGAATADARPYSPLRNGDQEIPWRPLGHLVFAYLTAPSDGALAQSPMMFFAMQNGQFVDVSARVAAGEIPLHLQ